MILRHAFIPLDNDRLSHLCGSVDEHLRDIEAALDVSISRRNESFRIEGPKPQAERAVALLQTMYDRARKPIPPEAFQLALAEAATAALRSSRRPDDGAEGERSDGDEIVLRTRRSDLAGRTPNQHVYLRNILDHDI
ncbi:MAG TPA: PhoH family protein, partial [Albitalea sp.]|nr:PhoH family protein [Albitalea sp.]